MRGLLALQSPILTQYFQVLGRLVKCQGHALDWGPLLPGSPSPPTLASQPWNWVLGPHSWVEVLLSLSLTSLTSALS